MVDKLPVATLVAGSCAGLRVEMIESDSTTRLLSGQS
jgi:hypothetical protein